MKKIIALLLFFILVATVACCYILWKRSHRLGELPAARYLPSETEALIDITDLQRTKVRWKETALYKISQEPEVAAFLQKPISLIPDNKETANMERFQKLDPKEIFVAAAGQGATGPKVIGGCVFQGDPKDAEALLAEAKSAMQAQFPGGRSDIQQYGAYEIETFTLQDHDVLATVSKGQWVFVSNDLDLMKSTLDRVDGKGDASTSLRENATFKTALAKMPVEPDALVFIQTKGFMDNITTMLSATPNASEAQMNELKKIQAISAAMKLDGERIRDAIYVYKPGGEAQPALARNSLAFTGPQTLFYFAAALGLGKAPALPNAALAQNAVLGMLGSLRQTLAQAGLGFDDFKAAFGPELGAVMNWEQNSVTPQFVLTLDVRDTAKAQKFLDTLATGWPKQEVDGTQFYSMPDAGAGMVPVSPALALTDKSLLLGLDIDTVKKAVQDAKSGGAGLDKSAGFQTASGLVGKPTGAFGYIDMKPLFEKVYAFASNSLKMIAIFNPHASQYCDLSKLPSTEAVSKHLSPIVYSQSNDENGSLIESAGPVTFTELIFGAGVGGAFWARTHLDALTSVFSQPSVVPSPTSPAVITSPPTVQSGATQPPSVQPSPPSRQVQTGVIDWHFQNAPPSPSPTP